MQKLVVLVALAVLFSAFFLIRDNSPYVDEFVHRDQIQTFYQGKLELDPNLAMVPGYHMVLALISRIGGNSSLPFLRTINFVISLLSILVFYILVSKLDYGLHNIIIIQYIFFPILFPFFFLVYTDVFSLLLVLLAFYFMLQNDYTLSAILGLLSLSIRQDNIIWLIFLFIYTYFKDYGKFDMKTAMNHFRKNWIFILGFVLSTIFLVINKGQFAMGDYSKHPSFSFHMGNVFLILILFFLLFLPLNLINIRKIFFFIKNDKKILLYLIPIFILYLFTFNDTITSAQIYFLRNLMLYFINLTIVTKIAFFIPVAYSIFSLFVTRLKDRQCYLLYPATFLSLVPEWLIEPRYYLIPFILFIAVREKQSTFIESIMAVYYFIFSLAIYFLIYKNWYFL